MVCRHAPLANLARRRASRSLLGELYSSRDRVSREGGHHPKISFLLSVLKGFSSGLQSLAGLSFWLRSSPLATSFPFIQKVESFSLFTCPQVLIKIGLWKKSSFIYPLPLLTGSFGICCPCNLEKQIVQLLLPFLENHICVTVARLDYTNINTHVAYVKPQKQLRGKPGARVKIWSLSMKWGKGENPYLVKDKTTLNLKHMEGSKQSRSNSTMWNSIFVFSYLSFRLQRSFGFIKNEYLHFCTGSLTFFLNGFILYNICDDSWVLSWAVGADLNSATRGAQPPYHIWTALPVIFASLWRLSYASPLCALHHFPRFSCCFSHGFTVLILFPIWSITLHCSTCLWKVNWSKLGLWEMFHLIVRDTCAHAECAHGDNGDVTLSRAEDKQLRIGPKTRWGC